MSKILLKGGHIVDPHQKIDGVKDILIVNGLIEEISPKSVPGDAETINISGKLVFPGLVDMHVHGREPGEEYKEDIESASNAAAAGGFTSIVLMANTVPPIDSAEKVTFIYDRSAEAAVWVYPVGAVSKGMQGKEIAELADIAQAGAVALSDDGHPIADVELMRNALTYADQLDLPILVHEIDPILASDGQINEGEISSITGMKGIPTQAETMMISRDVSLLPLTGGRLHIQHITTAESVEIVRKAKKENLDVTCEVTPHHLLLTDKAVLDSGFDSNFRMMPPLRSKKDIEALIDALTDGTIDVIATDHAPHAIHEKDNPFDQSPFGIIGLETALSLIWTKLVKPGKITALQMVDLMSLNPAKILDLPAGSLVQGSFADITVFDPDAKWTVDPKKFKSKSKNTPFTGWKLEGKVVMTMVAGEIVYKAMPK